MTPVQPDGSNKGADFEIEPGDKTAELLAPEVIRSEVNLLVLPFFALWNKDIKRKTKTEYKATVNRGGERLEISWIVSSNAEFGYPGPFDRTVHKAVEQIVNELAPPIQNPIPLGSLYSLCRRIGIRKLGGSQYRKIKEALTRIVATTIISKGAFYSKEKEGWVEDVFHLYERVVFKGEKLINGEIADTNYLFLSSWYLDNINNYYVKPVDWIYYKSLKTPVSQRIYELLSVKFYGLIMRRGRSISYRYSNLCKLLPVNRQRYLSDAKKLLDPAHSKLKETGFLNDWDWEETSGDGDNDWLIRYYPGKRAKDEIKRFGLAEQLELELPPPKEEKASDAEPELSDKESRIAEKLLSRGITRTTAKKLATGYPIDQIQRQMQVFDWLRETKSPLIGKSPAGFLRKSIEDNYELPKEYLDIQVKKNREEEENQRRARWLNYREELIKQDIASWDTIPPTERVAGILDFWIAGEKINGRYPTTEQVEDKRRELIDNLPKTDEQKWEHISRDYPENPPDEFE